MNNYICKIADLNEMNTKWDYEISIHPGDISWSLYKTKFIESAKKGNRVSYYGILNGKIICEATAIFNKEDVEGLFAPKRGVIMCRRNRLWKNLLS